MRHNKKFNHLGRKTAHRDSMLSNMAVSLIEHKKITTTLAKAKALRKFVEPLITKAKEDTTASRRIVFSQLQNKERALQILKAKLYDMEVQKQMKEVTDLRRSQVGTGDRSERIRTYNFPQGRLTDHRLNQNLNVWTVIDGDLDDLLNLLIEYDQKLKLEAKYYNEFEFYKMDTEGIRIMSHD